MKNIRLIAPVLFLVFVAAGAVSWWFLYPREGVSVSTDPCELWQLPEAYDFTLTTTGEGLGEMGSDVGGGERDLYISEGEGKVNGEDYHLRRPQTKDNIGIAEVMLVAGKRYVLRQPEGTWTIRERPTDDKAMWHGLDCVGLENVRYKGRAKTRDGRVGEHYTAELSASETSRVFNEADDDDPFFTVTVKREFWVGEDKVLLQSLADIELYVELFDRVVQTVHMVYTYSDFGQPNPLTPPVITNEE